MALALVFILTILSGLVAVTGGNGLILMPVLLMLGYNIKEIMALIRISAVVFVSFNLIAMIRDEKSNISFSKKDFLITTIVSCVSILFSFILLNRINNINLILLILAILIVLFFLTMFKPKQTHKLSWLFVLILPVFAGICGVTVGGAGLVVSILYTLLGAEPSEAVQKKVIPSLIIQTTALIIFLTHGIVFSLNLMYTVIIATAISGYLNMRIFMKLSSRNSKILFYASFIFSILCLIGHAIENILQENELNWIDLVHFLK